MAIGDFNWGVPIKRCGKTSTEINGRPVKTK